jgi:triphosphoribosyl-dephospho-CoA synthase
MSPQVSRWFRVRGARQEAQNGFPTILELGLPALISWSSQTASLTGRRLNALMSIMTRLNDSCLLRRGGWAGLNLAQSGAARVLRTGGAATPAGERAMATLGRELIAGQLSPGGSADLLAGTFFLDAISSPSPAAQSQWKH